jgi:hypothetical protein
MGDIFWTVWGWATTILSITLLTLMQIHARNAGYKSFLHVILGGNKMGIFSHEHKWKYMFSSKENEYSWYYCPECMAQCATKINQYGYVEKKIYPSVESLKKKKQ